MLVDSGGQQLSEAFDNIEEFHKRFYTQGGPFGCDCILDYGIEQQLVNKKLGQELGITFKYFNFVVAVDAINHAEKDSPHTTY